MRLSHSYDTLQKENMIETTFAFLAGFLLTWPALIGLAFLGVLFENNGSRWWAVTTAIVLSVVAYFFFAVPLTTIFIGSVGYIFIGLVWSFYRYKRHTISVVAKFKSAKDAYVRQLAIQELQPSNMIPTITAWILIWPFSLIENLVGDVINSVQLLVTKFFRSVYYRIYESAVKELE